MTLPVPTIMPTFAASFADPIPSKTVIFLACQISHRHISYGRCTGWWRGLDSNQRRHSQRVYSPSPLTARAPLHPGQLHCFLTACRKAARKFMHCKHPCKHKCGRHKQRREAKPRPAHAPCLGQSEYVLTAVNVNPFPGNRADKITDRATVSENRHRLRHWQSHHIKHSWPDASAPQIHPRLHTPPQQQAIRTISGCTDCMRWLRLFATPHAVNGGL